VTVQIALTCAKPGRTACWYNLRVTLIEITFDLQRPPTAEQTPRLGSFANTYGLRRFRLSAEGRKLTVEYDASRLKRTEVANVLRRAGIAVAGEAEAASA
jgi:hypothetical protein